MELHNVEIAAVEEIVKEADAMQICELQALQLALIGGGIAEVILG